MYPPLPLLLPDFPSVLIQEESGSRVFLQLSICWISVFPPIARLLLPLLTPLKVQARIRLPPLLFQLLLLPSHCGEFLYMIASNQTQGLVGSKSENKWPRC
ncbi:unnamed protein product [Protopolystoma xenopodis]|uniref:Uncharacterized protein n=1 Tax=Protopolystoma xenopodis TaxID=117903 RepID=A0A3S5CM07_9PLAT|nr:unnamed protein product [Protopolystoma xenopodis]